MATDTSAAVAKVCSKIDSSVEEGDAYTALQRYRTHVSRNQKKGEQAVARDIAAHGAIHLLNHGDVSAATDLALCLFPLYKEWDQSSVFDTAVKPTLMRIGTAYPEDMSAINRKHHIRFLKESIELSTKWGKYAVGDPDLHHTLALSLVRGENPGLASAHFVHSHRPEEFAKFVFTAATKRGVESEVDVFLTRAVLQLLALENLKDANAFHTKWAELADANSVSRDTPLQNFVRFLLQTMERDALPLFQVLRTKYESALRRDGKFPKYLDRIADKFFGLKAQKTGMAAMMDNMMGMLGGGGGR